MKSTHLCASENKMEIKIIDVTLRDGGYKTNFHYSNQQIENILNLLDKSGVDYIEIGYRNGPIRPILNIGNAGICDKKYLKKCRDLIQKTNLAVMLHAKNIVDDDIKELADCGVDLVRMCVTKNQVENNLIYVDKAKEYGLSVSINITRASQYTKEELNTLFFILKAYKNIDMIYFADSNGSMFPSNIKLLYETYTPQFHIPFGFHAHDNLGLAQANAIAAIEGGAQCIDTSLSGIGKGIGNLRLEFFASYLQAIGITKYDIEKILTASNFVHNTIDANKNITIHELMMGIHDLSIDDIEKLKQEQKVAA